MSVCQKYMTKYSIETKSEPLISIPETGSKSDELFKSNSEFFEKFIKILLIFLKSANFLHNTDFLFGFEFSVYSLVGFQFWVVKFGLEILMFN